MDFRQLRYFVTIVDSGTLTQASHRLHVVQSALSQRLAAMEASMGVQLLVRGRAGLVPTEAGLELYSRAKLILKQMEATRAAVQERAGVACGPVGIGLLRSLAPVLGMELFSAIREELPQVRPEIVVGYSDELVRMLRDAQLDVSLGVQQQSDTLLEGRFLFSEGVYLLGHPSLLGSATRLRIEDLQRIPLLVSSRHGPIQQVLDMAAQARGFSLAVVGSLEDQASVIELCAGGSVATYVPQSTALHLQRKHPALVAVPIEAPGLARKVFAYTHSGVPRTGTVMAVERILVRLLEARFTSPSIPS